MVQVKYEQLHDGEWVTPIMRGYRIKCCDCGLVHVLNFKVKSTGKRTRVMFQATRKR